MTCWHSFRSCHLQGLGTNCRDREKVGERRAPNSPIGKPRGGASSRHHAAKMNYSAERLSPCAFLPRGLVSPGKGGSTLHLLKVEQTWGGEDLVAQLVHQEGTEPAVLE